MICGLPRHWLVLSLLLAWSVSTPAADQAPELKAKSWKETQQWIADQKGQVVVVDIWTTTCGTCREEIPHFVELHQKYAKQGLRVLAVNCDFDGVKDKPPEFYRPQVEQFLKEHKARFENVLLTVPFLDFLEQQKLNTTPAVLVFGRDGKLVNRFDNDNAETVEQEFRFADVEQLVQRQLQLKP